MYASSHLFPCISSAFDGRSVYMITGVLMSFVNCDMRQRVRDIWACYDLSFVMHASFGLRETRTNWIVINIDSVGDVGINTPSEQLVASPDLFCHLKQEVFPSCANVVLLISVMLTV